ncbi:hypothetical protein [Sphingomonas japonica]|uniref:ElaB/YqjD/DUF883 family membrane-anchored ribosome-binding protein n=1 Tax=Sphingomonas japonica TaxID=511662 RepID=A0ABX0U2T7_9SPHN|nr:hypothetical protein [Sphingomonas japonica]NIJ24884.1 ElaB/YqjD/DUF883 family membrane-anchored ribosome-binding protein [Sphingomonas japonica]
MSNASDRTAANDRDRRGSILDKTRNSAAQAVDKTRDTATHAAEVTRDGARDAATKTAEAIENNPVVALVGGIAVGAALGALLPKTSIERQHLAPLGKRITESAAAAARAARDAGRDELGALAPDKDMAKAKASSFLETVAAAAKDSAKATAKA